VATATTRPIVRRTLGRADIGRRLSLAQFIRADFEEGWLYELARGYLVVTDVPGVEHARIINRLATMFVLYDSRRPGLINLRGGGGETRLRLPGMQSERHPDQAIYLTEPPPGRDPWSRWVPEIVVEVVSDSSRDRDYVETRDEYLRAGVQEYWILDPSLDRLLVLRREGDVWTETTVPLDGAYRTHRLPGLVVRPAELLGRTKPRRRRGR
jgi:Uma2 family endonuclease